MTSGDRGNVTEIYTRHISELLTKLEQGLRGRIAIKEDASQENAWEISPTTSNGAKIYIGVDSETSTIVLGVGEDTSLEISETEGYTSQPPIQELGALLNATTEGNFWEELWYKRGSIVKSQGFFRIGNEVIDTFVSRHLGTTPFLRGAEKKIVKYEPY